MKTLDIQEFYKYIKKFIYFLAVSFTHAMYYMLV